MSSNYTVIQSVRQHFGDQPNSFTLEPDAPFVGRAKNFKFSCPNVNPREMAVLMFQSLAVDHQQNIFQINGKNVFGRIPASPNEGTWNGNIMVVEPEFGLKEEGNILHVASPVGGGNRDDFILDNIVIMYKTRNSNGDVLPNK